MSEEIDKKNASEIWGVPGLKYKVGEKRYNARWEEMEFVEYGIDDSPDIWQVKGSGQPQVDTEPLKVPPAPEFNIDDVEEDRKPVFNWNMKKDDIIAELDKRDIIFDPTKSRNHLLKVLRESV